MPVSSEVMAGFLISSEFNRVFFQSRPHEAAPPPPVDTREKREDRDYRDFNRDSSLRELKEMRDTREGRDREREVRERDREGREREFSSKEKRSSKLDVPVVPMVDHRPGEDKQRPRSSQELKHPRSAVLSTVVLPLFAEVNIFSGLWADQVQLCHRGSSAAFYLVRLLTKIALHVADKMYRSPPLLAAASTEAPIFGARQ